MRRRVVREVGTVFGVAIIVAAVVFANGQYRRGTMKRNAISARVAAEKARKSKGLDLLHWSTIRETTGGYYSGPTFGKKLLSYDKDAVDLVGFQVPLEQFRNMSVFIVLPMPIVCYFCDSPPMKDVVLVEMRHGQTAPLVREPVCINGQLVLHKGPETQFFYVIRDATWGPGDPNLRKGELHRRVEPLAHRLHNFKLQMLNGTTPPTAKSSSD